VSDPPVEPVQPVPGEAELEELRDEPSIVDVRGGLRRRAAQGTIVNSAFQVGLAGVGLLQRLLVAAFLTREEFGLWGILIATLVTLSWLKQIGIADKYIQQSEPDQEAAFQKAFTLELAVSLLFFLLIVVVLPIYALAYSHASLIVPGIVLALSVPLSAFETPAWIPYRELNFVRQRVLTSINPLTAFVVTVTLGALGAGYWCLVIGAVAGAFAGGLVASLTCPYPLRLRFDRGTLRDYASFSWPLVGFGMSNLIAVQGTLLVANRSVGLAGIGVIGLAGSIAGFADRVDTIVSQTIYPVVCRVADRVEVLHEAFVKSNRVTLMWSVPFGVGLALFAGDLVTYVLGEKWRAAENVLIGVGLIVALGQVAYNWTIFMRAVNDTRPIFLASLLGVVSFAAVMVPALLTLDLDGYIIGLGAGVALQLVARGYFLRRLFPGFGVLRHLLRAIAPSLPAAALVLAVRAAVPGERSLAVALAELALYAIATVAFTYLFERRLVLELLGYLRRRRAPAAVE
jgi:O-antigen/teichoic acid export membrane protein